MRTAKILKREGIEVEKMLSPIEVDSIAENIANKICDSFPEYNIDRNALYSSLNRLNMYIAKMPNNLISAKYFYKNSSIYFNSKNVNFDNLSTLALHECIHYIQELKNSRGKLLRLGLYNLEGFVDTGMALNEAAVQLMASIATNSPKDSVKYYNMNLTTESPTYYPLQCSLMNQLLYFTGTYPLFYSTLYSNDVFKNTLITKSNEQTYSTIDGNFDKIVKLEDSLSSAISELSITNENSNRVSELNLKIDDLKHQITNTCLETQHIIIENFFNAEFNSIKNLDEIETFKERLDNFKSVLIENKDDYFYDNYCKSVLYELEKKEAAIKEYGSFEYLSTIRTELATIEDVTYGVSFFKKLFNKFGLLFKNSFSFGKTKTDN